MAFSGTNLWRAVALVATLLVVAACGGTPDRRATDITEVDRPDQSDFSVYARDPATIAPADVLQIDVFRVEELGGLYTVGADGQFKFPLIGLVQAEGLTAVELSARIETALAADYLQAPDVRVVFEERPGSTITVEGAVEDPGIKEVPGPVSLLQAVALAGGPSVIADPKEVTVFRMASGRRIAATYNILDIREGRAPDPVVHADDIVVVDPSKAKERFEQIVRVAPFFNVFRFF